MRDADEDLRLGCVIAAALWMNALGPEMAHGVMVLEDAQEVYRWVTALREKEPTDENV